MSSERGLWSTMQDNVGPFGSLKRVENTCDLGTPDLCAALKLPDGKPRHGVRIYRTAMGWVELKECEWPKRPDTPLFIKRLTLDQVLWQEGWERTGGRVMTLIQADRDYLVVPPAVLRMIYERTLPRAELQSFLIGSGTFPTAAFIKRFFE